MIDHVSIAVSDLVRSAAFYESVLAPLGYVKLVVRERTIGFGKSHAELWINLRDNLGKPPAAVGAHVAFRARDEQAVMQFHAAALAQGGADDGAPGPRPYGAGPNIYYAAFVIDPDGNKIEAVTFLPPGRA
ncbi:MAG: VOC family protein [Hyphomicrobiales bacterium]|nr:VOC family protein [Hyphomicrobiales bacterium]